MRPETIILAGVSSYALWPFPQPFNGRSHNNFNMRLRVLPISESAVAETEQTFWGVETQWRETVPQQTNEEPTLTARVISDEVAPFVWVDDNG